MEKKPEESTGLAREDKAVIALLKAIDYINQITAKTMEPYEVTSNQYNALRILRGAGPEGLPTLELAERMVVHSPGVTRMIDRLEKKELVKRARSPKDRRVVHCVIRKKGLELLGRMDVPVARMNRQIVRNLDQHQLDKLVDLLHRLRE